MAGFYSRIAGARRVLCLGLAAYPVLIWQPAAAEPVPLPPPPELMFDAGFEEFEDEAGAPVTSPEERRQALAPPVTVQPVTAAPDNRVPPHPLPAGPATQTVISTRNDFTISPPSRQMPDEYYNLPVAVDGAGIPGIVMPELDHSFTEPGRGAAVRRPAGPGLSIRQLEPFFALAKGSESMALEARNAGDEMLYADQIAKAIDAYLAIIGMADAGSEAREEAWYGVARCEYRRGNWWQAFDALERSFPKAYERGEVEGRIKLEMFIGERLWRIGPDPVAGTGGDDGPLTGYQAASLVYEKAIFNQPSAQDAPVALLRRGDAASLAENWEEAVRHYRQVVEYYPESDQAMQARSSLTEAVYRQEWVGGFPEAGRDDVGRLMDDVERQYGRLSPEAEERRLRAVALANSLEAETKLAHAKSYLTSVRVRKSRDAAVFLLGEVVSRFPETEQAGEAAAILRGLGVEPPMVLSDGNRFPLTSGWSGIEVDDPDDDGRFAGGSVVLGGQDAMSRSIDSLPLPESPTRETVYAAPVPVPAVADDESF
ncbi:MAG: tetratricopeptide repeat protein [Planctomycetes bacterium]|nr:tetratricopeptide repeat protein [Planctomycetota bacterium]